jgi:hypothetical protein
MIGLEAETTAVIFNVNKYSCADGGHIYMCGTTYKNFYIIYGVLSVT